MPHAEFPETAEVWNCPARTSPHASDHQDPRVRSRRRERPWAGRLVRRRTACSRGRASLSQRRASTRWTRSHWDVLRLYSEMLHGLAQGRRRAWRAGERRRRYLGRRFRPARPRRHAARQSAPLSRSAHRRHHGGRLRRVPATEIFRQTGIQFMRFNTLFQLLALKRDRSPLLDAAETLLMIPDLFHYLLTGIKVNEYTDASTSQMIDPHTPTLGRRPGPPRSACPTTSSARWCSRARCSARCGPRSPTRSAALGSSRSSRRRRTTPPPRSPPCPRSGESWAYISSGTWSLMGVETRHAADRRASAGMSTSPTRAASAARFGCSRTSWACGSCRNAAVPGNAAARHIRYAALMRLAEARRRSPASSTPMTTSSSCRRHAGRDRRLLPQDGPARAARAGRRRPLRPGEPGAALSLGAGAAGRH